MSARPSGSLLASTWVNSRECQSLSIEEDRDTPGRIQIAPRTPPIMQWGAFLIFQGRLFFCDLSRHGAAEALRQPKTADQCA